GVGAALSINNLTTDTTAKVTGSKVTQTGGGLDVSASSTNPDPSVPRIVSGTLSIGASSDVAGVAGMVSLNFMDNTTEAELVNSTYTSNGSLTVEATDSSSIYSVGGAVGAAVGGGGTNLGIGLAIAYNEIDGGVLAAITDSEVFAQTGVTVSGTS